MRRGCGLPCLCARSLMAPRRRAPNVLRVGTYHGIRGQYTSIQAAVDGRAAGRLDPGRARRLQDDSSQRADGGAPTRPPAS